MANNNSITLTQLSKNPLIAYSIRIPEPQIFELSDYEETAYPAIFGNLTEMSISKVSAKYRMGGIYSFDILPRSAPDPIIIFSQAASFALTPYYRAWSDIMKNGIGGMWRGRKEKMFSESIQYFIDTCRDTNILPIEDVVFATIEMLKFKNDIILNWR